MRQRHECRADEGAQRMTESGFPHVAAALYGTPLAVDRLKLTAIVEALGPRIIGQPGALRGPATVARTERPYLVTRGVAIVPVVGLLVHRTGGAVTPDSVQLRSYMEIGADMKRAMSDP